MKTLKRRVCGYKIHSDGKQSFNFQLAHTETMALGPEGTEWSCRIMWTHSKANR